MNFGPIIHAYFALNMYLHVFAAVMSVKNKG